MKLSTSMLLLMRAALVEELVKRLLAGLTARKLPVCYATAVCAADALQNERCYP